MSDYDSCSHFSKQSQPNTILPLLSPCQACALDPQQQLQSQECAFVCDGPTSRKSSTHTLYQQTFRPASALFDLEAYLTLDGQFWSAKRASQI
jgi:hypothetical protein